MHNDIPDIRVSILVKRLAGGRGMDYICVWMYVRKFVLYGEGVSVYAM